MAKTLSLDIETLVELTPEDARNVNGGATVSSVMPQPHHGPVSSAKPPVHHHKKPVHHAPVSSAKPATF